MLKRILPRPRGVKRKMVRPKGKDEAKQAARMVALVSPPTAYQLAVRLFITKGYEWATRAILDTGSGPSLVRKQALPRGFPMEPLGDLETLRFYDVNGGWLPIVGSVTLGVCVGKQISYISFGVVPNMCVPVILGNTFVDHETKSINSEDQTVTLLSGETVPILRGVQKNPRRKPNREAVCACPRGGNARLVLTQKTLMRPGTIAHVQVRGNFQGHGYIRGKSTLHSIHGAQLAEGPATLKPGQPTTVQVMNPTKRPVRLRAGMAIGHITVFDGVSQEASTEELKDPEPKPAPKESSLAPGIDLGKVPEGLRAKLTALLERYNSLWDGTLGTIKETVHRIRLKPGAVPVRQHPYKSGPRTRLVEEEQVRLMDSLGVIEPSHGEWASPVVIVPKPGGGKRFCIDYRRLNEMTVKDAYPIPRMDECLDSLGNANVFSTLDCNAGYWQIPVAKEDRPLTAFTCHSGTWQCKRLPFGLCNAPATFQRAMDMILAGVKWQICLVYLDDVIVFSKSAEDHLEHLETVLSLLKAHGVSLKANKCHLFQEEVDYLGHVIRPGRVLVNEKNTRALRGLQYPRTQTQMKSFLGMCGVYRRFVRDFAKVAKPLTALTSTKLPTKLSPPTEVERNAFETLRGLLLSPPVLAIPRIGGHYIVDVDASYEQLGCCLLQQQPDGEYLPVGYYSRPLNPAERNYHVTEIEALGVVWAVTHLRSYLEGEEFVIRCDHRALLSVLATNSPNIRINRWRLRLSEFTYKLRYKPGADHKVADALSRLPTDEPDKAPIDEDLPVLATVTRSAQALAGRSEKHRPLGPITVEELIRAQAEDTFCLERRKEWESVPPPDPKWARKAFFFENEEGILCRRSFFLDTTQMVIPSSLRERLMTYHHELPLAAHPGARRMYATLRRGVYWPTMIVDVYKHVSQCTGCARNRLDERRHTSTLKLFPANEPFASLAMDILGPLPASENGNRFILVMVDRFSKLTRAVPMKEITAVAVASAFIDVWVASYGIPDSTLTDNGPQFASVFFQGVLGLLGIEAKYTTPYHPQTNGQVERYNRTIMRQLRVYTAEHPKEWDRYVSLLTTAYNTQVHSSTGQAPLMFVSPRRLQTMGVERLPKLRPLKEKEDLGEGEDEDSQTAALRFVEDLKSIIPQVRKHLAKAQEAYKKTFDATVAEKNKDLREGDWVFLASHTRKRSKLAHKSVGPYMVLRTDGRRFTVETPSGIRTVTSDHATRAPAPQAGHPAWARAEAARANFKVAQPSPSTGDGKEYVFEKFVDHRFNAEGALELRIRWFGYGPQDDTWRLATGLPAEAVRKYCRRRKLKIRVTPSGIFFYATALRGKGRKLGL